MATYSDKSFDTLLYNTARPNYPDQYYETLLKYHSIDRDVAVDVGCGSGFVAFKLTNYFKHVVGTDISEAMILQCNSTKGTQNISFKQCPAEKLAFEDNSVDLVASAEALHWVNTDLFFKEAWRILKPGGTLSYWFYKEPIFIDFPHANDLYDVFCYGESHLGPYWEQPGKNRLRIMLRDTTPADSGFVDVIREEYDPLVPEYNHPTTLYMAKTTDLQGLKSFFLSWSAYHSWKKLNSTKKDIVDEFIDDLKPIIGTKEFTVVWGTVYTLARKQL